MVIIDAVVLRFVRIHHPNSNTLYARALRILGVGDT